MAAPSGRLHTTPRVITAGLPRWSRTAASREGSPASASASATGPGLVYGRSGRSDDTPLVLSFGRLSAVLGRAAAHLGLLVWVADHGLAHEVRLPLGVPSMLIRGSDRFAPDATRVGSGGP